MRNDLPGVYIDCDAQRPCCHEQPEPTCCRGCAGCGKPAPCSTEPPCAPRYPAMVYAAGHTADHPYTSQQALCRGTLFPCLDKPLHGEGRCAPACAGAAQQLNFAAWELRLYLDTHPHDQEALCELHRLCQQLHGSGYACALLPDCSGDWSWLNGPWPWEYTPCGRKEA